MRELELKKKKKKKKKRWDESDWWEREEVKDKISMKAKSEKGIKY